MKILMVQNRFYPAVGGAETHVCLLSKGLVKRGHEVTVYTTNSLSNKDVATIIHLPPFINRGEKKKKLPQEEYLNGIHVKRFNFKFKYWGFHWIPDMFKELKENIKNFDVIHAHGYHLTSSLVSCYYAKKWNKSFILTAHDLIISESFPMTTKTFKKIHDLSVGKWILKNSSKLIALTENQIPLYEERGADKSKIVVIPNGIVLEEHTNYDSSKIKIIEEKYDINHGDNIILFVGRIEKYKGIQDVIKIMPQLLNKFTNIKFVVVGKDFGLKSELIELAKKLKVEGNTIFTDLIPKKDLIALYKRASIFILPSTMEGFGIVIIEAMAAKTLCIAYPISSVRNVIKNNETGVLVKDKNELLNKILYYLNNIEERRRIEANALKYVEKYDIKNIENSIEKVYEEVLN